MMMIITVSRVRGPCMTDFVACSPPAAGMNENPADHVDTAAFQPSHTLSLEIPAGTVAEFFEEVLAEDVGKVCLCACVLFRNDTCDKGTLDRTLCHRWCVATGSLHLEASWILLS